jgi:hypothetical protein
MLIDIKGWPVMAAKCPSCPFRENGDTKIEAAVLERTGLHASQICHHPRLRGGEEHALCRGARDHQLEMLFRLGWIDAPTDEAFARKSLELGL